MEYTDGKMVHVHDRIMYTPNEMSDPVECVITAVWNNKKLYVLSIDHIRQRGYIRRYIVEDMSHVKFIEHLTEEGFNACLRDAEKAFKK